MTIWIKVAISILLGLFATAVLLVVAFGVGGIGHGWMTPLWFSFTGVVLFPATVLVLMTPGRNATLAAGGLFILGLLLDLAIYTETVREGLTYFRRAGGFAYVWIGLWATWQVALMVKVLHSSFKNSHPN